jgi:hypothetical protein
MSFISILNYLLAQIFFKDKNQTLSLVEIEIDIEVLKLQCMLEKLSHFKPTHNFVSFIYLTANFFATKLKNEDIDDQLNAIVDCFAIELNHEVVRETVNSVLNGFEIVDYRNVYKDKKDINNLLQDFFLVLFLTGLNL